MDLEIPAWDAEPWNDVASDLGGLLGFLTADRWSLTFRNQRCPRSKSVTPIDLDGAVATLFSGGADSLSAAILFQAELGSPPILVSHRDTTLIKKAQDSLVSELAGLWGEQPRRFTGELGRSSTQLGSGLRFGLDLRSRSRSVLFLALGLVAASAAEVPLRIPENGFASLNPPMGGERRSALSTRTTHPWFLTQLSRILEATGAHAAIENPFVHVTKGEMFKQVSTGLGVDEASQILSQSRSCARTNDLRFAGVPGASHCGVCFGCLVRRGAFLAASLDDLTTYAVEDFSMPLGTLANGWYNEKRARDLQAARYATSHGADVSDIARHLPEDHDIAAAIDVANRGLAEIGQLIL